MEVGLTIVVVEPVLEILSQREYFLPIRHQKDLYSQTHRLARSPVQPKALQFVVGVVEYRQRRYSQTDHRHRRGYFAVASAAAEFVQTGLLLAAAAAAVQKVRPSMVVAVDQTGSLLVAAVAAAEVDRTGLSLVAAAAVAVDQRYLLLLVAAAAEAGQTSLPTVGSVVVGVVQKGLHSVAAAGVVRTDLLLAVAVEVVVVAGRTDLQLAAGSAVCFGRIRQKDLFLVVVAGFALE